MRSHKLSRRLQTIAQYIPDQSVVADIGGDHALLLCHLASEGRLKHGIIGEVNKGPYENAMRNVKQFGFDKIIDVRLGDGLSILQPNEVETIVVAGMGGDLIRRILSTGLAVHDQVERLILQPNIGSRQLRGWLHQHCWQLIEETIVEDEGLMYEVLVATSGSNSELYQDPQLSDEILLEIGPLLWKRAHPLLAKKLRIDLVRKKKMVEQLSQGKSERVQKKWKAEVKKTEELQRVIQCLSMDIN